jgi:hypothetical protein
MSKGMPNTIMAAAFMQALRRWAQRNHAAGMIAVPSGRVEIAELVKVIVALNRLRKSHSQ